jgi:hypothetical protein
MAANTWWLKKWRKTTSLKLLNKPLIFLLSSINAALRKAPLSGEPLLKSSLT